MKNFKGILRKIGMLILCGIAGVWNLIDVIIGILTFALCRVTIGHYKYYVLHEDDPYKLSIQVIYTMIVIGAIPFMMVDKTNPYRAADDVYKDIWHLDLGLEELYNKVEEAAFR